MRRFAGVTVTIVTAVFVNVATATAIFVTDKFLTITVVNVSFF